jgi:hypothetical protein
MKVAGRLPELVSAGEGRLAAPNGPRRLTRPRVAPAAEGLQPLVLKHLLDHRVARQLWCQLGKGWARGGGAAPAQRESGGQTLAC